MDSQQIVYHLGYGYGYGNGDGDDL